MSDDAPRARTRAETPDEAALARWFETQARDPFTSLEEAARQIVQLVTALYAVVFGILAFAANPVPTYLARLSVQSLGLVAVLSYLVALLAALVVIVPQRYSYASAKITQQREVFAAIVGRKRWALVVAVWAFGVASVAFAGLFVVVALGI